MKSRQPPLPNMPLVDYVPHRIICDFLWRTFPTIPEVRDHCETLAAGIVDALLDDGYEIRAGTGGGGEQP